jgi:hypothetical protein
MTGSSASSCKITTPSPYPIEQMTGSRREIGASTESWRTTSPASSYRTNRNRVSSSISLTHLRRYHGDDHEKLKWYLMNYSYQGLGKAKKVEYKTQVEQIRRARDNMLGRGENENLIRWIHDEIHRCSQFCQVYHTYALE